MFHFDILPFTFRVEFSITDPPPPHCENTCVNLAMYDQWQSCCIVFVAQLSLFTVLKCVLFVCVRGDTLEIGFKVKVTVVDH